MLFPRIPDDASDPETAKAYVNAIDLFGPISDLFAVLANAPTLLDGWVDMVRNLRHGLKVEPRFSEIAIVRAAQIGRADFVQAAHGRLAVKADVPQEKVDAIPNWRESPVFDDDDRLVLEFAEQIAADGTANADIVRQMQDRFGVREAAELIIATSYYCCVSRVVTSMEITSLSRTHD